MWELTERPAGEWLLRCDRVDFPPGGVAYLHTHPGPGLRVLLKGRIRIDTEGASHEYGPFEWWYETGPDPVFAAASETEETAFVRVLVLPQRVGREADDHATSTRPTRRSRSCSAPTSTSSTGCEPARRQAADRPARGARHGARVLRARARATSSCSTGCTSRRSG